MLKWPSLLIGQLTAVRCLKMHFAKLIGKNHLDVSSREKRQFFSSLFFKKAFINPKWCSIDSIMFVLVSCKVVTARQRQGSRGHSRPPPESPSLLVRNIIVLSLCSALFPRPLFNFSSVIYWDHTTFKVFSVYLIHSILAHNVRLRPSSFR